MRHQGVQAIEATRAALSSLDGLAALDGWNLVRHQAAGELTGRGTPESMVEAVKSLASLVSNATLDGVFESARLSFAVHPTGHVTATGEPRGDIAESFGVDHEDDARLAWAGDTEAAFRLPGSWTCRIQLRWTQALEQSEPDTQWLVFWDTMEAAAYLKAQPFWRLGQAIDVTRGCVAFVRALAPTARVLCGALSVLSLDFDHFDQPPAPAASAPTVTDPVLVQAVDPRLIIPITVDGAVDHIASALHSLVVGTCWARLATSLDPIASSGEIELEYFGLQRVRHVISATGLDSDRELATESLDLIEWVEGPGTVDRLVAVRQVISLQADNPPWSHAGDVRAAAEPIFVALRTDAITEALRALRDARTSALEAARQTVTASSDLTKATVERALASLIAIGGLIVATTSKNLTSRQSTDLRLLLAGGLIGLAAWNLAIERPSLFRAIKDFKADLPSLSELLPSADRARVESLASLKNARRHSILVAVVIPVVYLGLAIVALVVTR